MKKFLENYSQKTQLAVQKYEEKNNVECIGTFESSYELAFRKKDGSVVGIFISELWKEMEK